MLKDIPYSVLKQDVRGYEIMLLRDQYGITFTDIAKEYEISVARAAQIYYRLKVRQIHLYINHIAIVLEFESTSPIRKVYDEAYECYQEWSYACGYMEKKYKTILTAYRNGEPGLPVHFIKSIPPFKLKLSKKTVARVIEMREVEKASFAAIAGELRITQAKAKRTYDMFYHKQVLELIRALQENADSHEEKMAIWDYYFRQNISCKTRYELIIKGFEDVASSSNPI